MFSWVYRFLLMLNYSISTTLHTSHLIKDNEQNNGTNLQRIMDHRRRKNCGTALTSSNTTIEIVLVQITDIGDTRL